MKRWLRQQDRYSCGPIALINLDKWRGKHVTKHDLPKYRRRCRCGRLFGTTIVNFIHTVGKSYWRPTYQHFKRYLLSGGVAIIDCYWTNGSGHYFFVCGIYDHTDGRRGFLAINYYEHQTMTLLSPQEMVSLLRRGRIWTFQS